MALVVISMYRCQNQSLSTVHEPASRVGKPSSNSTSLHNSCHRSLAILLSRYDRQLIPSFAFEQPTGFRLVDSAPLFEKERHAPAHTPVADLNNPRWLHWPRPRTGFTADDDPVDTGQRKPWNSPKQGFHGEESCRRGHLNQFARAPNIIRVLDTGSHPYIPRPRE